MAETNEYHNFFEVNAGQARRTVSVRDQRLQTTHFSLGEAGTLKFSVNSPEFSALLKLGTQRVMLTALDCKVVLVEESEGEHYVKLVTTKFRIEFEVFYKGVPEITGFRKTVTVRNLASKPIVLLDLAVELLECETVPPASRGGKGQPLFLEPFFGGVEFPTGENVLYGQTIMLRHFPGETLQPDQIYTSFPAVWSAITAGNAEESFQTYLNAIIRRPANKPLGIYTTWVGHDELYEKKVELTQKLATRIVSVLQTWQTRGISFPYFVLDYQWYEPGARELYLRFKEKNWPEGTEPFLELLKTAGLKLGLWFDTSGLRITGPPFPRFMDDGRDKQEDLPPNAEHLAKSRLRGSILGVIGRIIGRGREIVPCLIEGDFSLELQEALDYWAMKKGVQLLKLDFSRFACNNPHHDHLSGKYSEEKAIRNLVEMLGNVREINPELVVLAYTGYTEGLAQINNTVTPERQNEPSPWWLSHVDMLSCGDPRPSDVPTPHLRHSILCHTDLKVRQFHAASLPWRGIDDLGVLLGKTSTNYHLGKEDWRDAWIMELCRGHLKPSLSGDLSLLEEGDTEFLRATLDIFHKNVDIFAHPRPIGGNPNRGDVYGWLCQTPAGALMILALHNPGFLPRTFLLGDLGDEGWQEIYPVSKPVQKTSEIILAPSAVVLYVRGPIEVPPKLKGDELYQDGREIPIISQEVHQGPRSRRITGVLAIPTMGTRNEIFVVVQFTKALRPWRQLLQPNKQVTFKVKSQAVPVSVHSITPGRAWSAVSWVGYKLNHGEISPNTTVEFELTIPWEPSVEFHLLAYLLSYKG